MGNALLSYLNSRLHETYSAHKKYPATAGPVITISREVGCNGLKLANKLALTLNSHQNLNEWKVLSKEVFFKSARELNLEPDKVKKTIKKSDSYTFEQILNAFGDKRYKSEAKIAKTVRDVIHSLAIEGFNIIVGRAGHIIAHDVPNSLHLCLIAPLDYRILTIMENNKLSREAAIEFIDRVEKERLAFRKAMKEDSSHEDYFDLIINRASFTTNQAVDLIISTIEMKQIAAVNKQRTEVF